MRSNVRLFVSPLAAFCAITTFFSGSSLGAAEEEAGRRLSRPPNIVVILADDLGYGDLGCYGQRVIATPNIDRLCREGMKFTNFYAGSTVCAPSRCVLMTGQDTGQCRVRGNSTVPINQSLACEDVTVAEMLKNSGYATALVGKWGLGAEETPGLPNDQGFDFFYGYLSQLHAHNYYPDFLWRNREKVPLANVVQPVGRKGYWGGIATKKVQYSPDLMLGEAISFIDGHKDQPFFLYFASTLPHDNSEATNKLGDGNEVPDYGPYRDRPWNKPAKGLAAMITYLDMQVGKIIEHLRQLGLDDSTIVVFTSDNGPERGTSGDPKLFDRTAGLRGLKRDMYEGGIRVPLIVRWPGKIAAGSSSDHVASFVDFFATARDIAAPTTVCPDGSISLLPSLQGTADKQPKHPHLYWEFYELGSAQAVRSGKWKAVRRPMVTGKIELYDLEADVAESHNIAAAHPDVVQMVRGIMEKSHVPSELWKLPKRSR